MTLNKTKIEWCDATWSPISGCLHGCHYCYAKKHAENPFYRKGFPHGFEPTFYPERLLDPARQKKPRTIFVCSMSDAFGVWVSESWIEDIFTAIEFAPQHTYCLLTKNPERMKDWADYQKNIWWGTTVTGVDDTDRIRQLQKINSDNRFISFEPLLADPGVIDLKGIKGIIIGAQTNPLIMPTQQAIDSVEGAAFWNAGDLRSKIFYKDSIIDNNPTNMMFSRELMWNLYTKEATR